MLLSAGERDIPDARAAMTRAALNSPLLPRASSKACRDLQEANGFEFEYLVVCVQALH